MKHAPISRVTAKAADLRRALDHVGPIAHAMRAGRIPILSNIRIPAEHFATLADEARLRGYRSAGALVAALLATIARDRLVGAILDTTERPDR